MKTCTGCGKGKTEDSFSVGSGNMCKVCKAKYSRERWRNNPGVRKRCKERRQHRRATDPNFAEEEKIRAAVYRAEHPEKNAAHSAAFARKHPEYVLKWRRENEEHVREYNRTYWEKAKESHNELMAETGDCTCDWCYHTGVQKIWAAYNPERRAGHAATRRARKRKAPSDGSMTADVWARMRMEPDNCITCGSDFNGVSDRTQGHVVPLYVGGHHSTSNVIVQCRMCNSRQGTRILGKWMPSRDLPDVVSDMESMGIRIPKEARRAIKNNK